MNNLKYLRELHANQQNQLDKNLMLVATGGISFAFYLVRDGNIEECKAIFMIAVILFTISLCCGIFSFFFSVKCCEKLIKEEDDSLYQNLISYSNFAQLITVLLGVIFALIFLSQKI